MLFFFLVPRPVRWKENGNGMVILLYNIVCIIIVYCNVFFNFICDFVTILDEHGDRQMELGQIETVIGFVG